MDSSDKFEELKWKGVENFLQAQQMLRRLRSEGKEHELQKTLALMGWWKLDLDEFLAAKTYEDFMKCLAPIIGGQETE